MKKIICLLSLLFILMIPVSTKKVKAEAKSVLEEVNHLISGIIDNNGNYNADMLARYAGESMSDWSILAIYKMDPDYDFLSYRVMLKNKIEEVYLNEQRYDKMQPTDWARHIFASIATDMDPNQLKINGKTYHLLDDFLFSETSEKSLNNQGVNGWVFGLLALDTLQYPVFPQAGFLTREKIISSILSYELPDGGFSFLRDPNYPFDVDMTAMVMQALAPYYKKLEAHISIELQEKVNQVVDRSLDLLSKEQQNDGDYQSYGVSNPESTAQVLLALSSLQIDILQDERFIKNHNTMLEGLKKYRKPSGNFSRTEKEDAITSWQVLSALIAYRLYLTDRSCYFDLRLSQEEMYETRKFHSKVPKWTDMDTLLIRELEVELAVTSKAIVYSLLEKIEYQEETVPLEYKNRLTLLKESISKIEEKINLLNQKIYHQVLLKDKVEQSTLKEIEKEYDELSAKNQSLIEHYDEVVRLLVEGRVRNRSNLVRYLLISLLFLVICFILFRYIRKGKEKKGFAKDIIVVLLFLAMIVLFTTNLKIETVEEHYLIATEESFNEKETVKMDINLTSILKNWEKLDEKLRDEAYVPKSGYLIQNQQIPIKDGDSIYDVLLRVAKQRRVHLDTKKFTNSIYIKGINHIYEFSSGSRSGWMIKVNAELISTDAGSYELKPNDYLEIIYVTDYIEEGK